MNIKNKFKVSVVIPVYNEGDSLSACLTAIDNLNTKPYEVIVVDNNSTDHSKLIAQRHNVRLITEKKQGVVHARTRGFNAARGNIIARIDADTVLPNDWIERLVEVFERDSEAVAVSGSADYYDFFMIENFANRVDRWCRGYIAARIGNRMFLHGSNMAVKKSAWNKVKANLCPCIGLHEDLDFAIHLQEAGLKVIYEESLVAGISSRRISNGFKQFYEYSMASPRTYKAHGLRSRRHMYPVILLVFAMYYPGHLAYQTYDPKLGALSIKYLLSSKFRKTRIDPTINAA